MSLRIEQSVNIARPLRVEMEVQMAVIEKPILTEQLTIEPSIDTIEYLPSSGYYYDKVTANGVTSDIDENIQSLNIREGVTILGVDGNLAPDKPDQSKTVYPSTEQQVVVAETGFELAEVIVEPMILQEKIVEPTFSKQDIVADMGFDALSKVTLEPIPNEYVDTSGGTITPSTVASGYIGYSQGNEVIGTASLAEDTGTGEFEARYCFFNKYGRYQIVSKQANILGTFEKPSTVGDVPENVGYNPALIFQGWNFDDIELTNVTGDLDIGAIYIPADGKTHIYIDIENDTILDYTFNLTISNIGTGTFYFDFGDGTTAYSVATTGLKTIAHSYSAKGSYHITTWLEGADETAEILLGNDASLTSAAFLGDWDSSPQNNTIKKIYFGAQALNLRNTSIPRLRACEIVSFHNNFRDVNILYYRNLQYLIVPKSTTGGNVNIREGNERLVSVPPNITNISAFNIADTIYEKIIHAIAGNFSLVNASSFRPESYIKSLNIMNASQITLATCNAMKVSLSHNMTSLSITNAAQYRNPIKIIVMRAMTPPTLSGQLGYYCKIYVPLDSLSAYQSATNWSNYASQMVGY